MRTHLNSADAANFLNISKSCLEKSRVTGLLYGLPSPAFIRIGNTHARSKILYPIKNLEKWLSQHSESRTVATEGVKNTSQAKEVL